MYVGHATAYEVLTVSHTSVTAKLTKKFGHLSALSVVCRVWGGGTFKCVHRESEEGRLALNCSLVEPIQLLLLLDGHI